MLTKSVSDLLNNQINKELFSSYLYLEMSNYYNEQGLNGFSQWFNVQAQEEMAHAMLFLQYLQNNGEKVNLLAIDAPNTSFKNLNEPILQTKTHELFVTSLINTLYHAAYEDKDFRTMQFLDWFIKEQGEEEKNCDDLIKKFELFGTDAKALYMLDAELGARVYTPPSLVL